MGVVVVIAVLVGVYLLWRILQTQEARTEVEAFRTAQEITRNLTQDFATAHGTWEDAKRKGRLVEYVGAMARAFSMSDYDVRETFNRTADARREWEDLITETMERGVRSRFVTEDEYHHRYTFWFEFDPRKVQLTCAEPCDASEVRPDDPIVKKLKSLGLEVDYGSLWMPKGYRDECPFCGGPLEADVGEDEINEWRKDRKLWRKYKKLFPENAAILERNAHRVQRDARKAFEIILASRVSAR